jgi:hypothetical protein
MTKTKYCSTVVLTVSLSLFAASSYAQQVVSQVSRPAGISLDIASLPDAPMPVGMSTSAQQDAASQAYQTQKTPQQPSEHTRFLGIFPTPDSFSVDRPLPPQTNKEKAITGLKTAFGPDEFVISAAEAGFHQETNKYPEFRQGAAGYGRYFWHTYADQAVENLMVISVVPIATHEDSRYYRLGHGNVFHRAIYSFSRVAITRTDGGSETFNLSEAIGAGGAAGISSLYYPQHYRTWTKVGQRWLTNVVSDGASYLFDEFWPDVDAAIFHHSN